MIDVVLKFIVLFFLFLGYLIFLFSYRVFNGTSTRLILLSKFEDEDNANLIPELNFSQSTIRILVGIWSLGLAIHTIFIFYFYSNILLNSWLGALIYFFVSLICPLFGYFIVFSLNHKAVEKLIGIPKFILILTVLLLNLSVVRKFSSSSNGNNNEEKELFI